MSNPTNISWSSEITKNHFSTKTLPRSYSCQTSRFFPRTNVAQHEVEQFVSQSPGIGQNIANGTVCTDLNVSLSHFPLNEYGAEIEPIEKLSDSDDYTSKRSQNTYSEIKSIHKTAYSHLQSRKVLQHPPQSSHNRYQNGSDFEDEKVSEYPETLNLHFDDTINDGSNYQQVSFTLAKLISELNDELSSAYKKLESLGYKNNTVRSSKHSADPSNKDVNRWLPNDFLNFAANPNSLTFGGNDKASGRQSSVNFVPLKKNTDYSTCQKSLRTFIPEWMINYSTGNETDAFDHQYTDFSNKMETGEHFEFLEFRYNDWITTVDKVLFKNDSRAVAQLIKAMAFLTDETYCQQKRYLLRTIREKCRFLMFHHYGNYILQSSFEISNEIQIKMIVPTMLKYFYSLCTHKYGFHVIIKTFDYIDKITSSLIIDKLLIYAPQTICDPHGSQVWSKVLSLSKNIEFNSNFLFKVDEKLKNQWVKISSHQYGSIVVKNMLSIPFEQHHQINLRKELFDNLNDLSKGNVWSRCVAQKYLSSSKY